MSSAYVTGNQRLRHERERADPLVRRPAPRPPAVVQPEHREHRGVGGVGGERGEQPVRRRLRSDADPALIELGLAVFRELRWTGFASADAIRRRRGSHVFLEINPRPWGSIAAARSADVDLFAPFAAPLAGELPAADLAFTADRDCHVFPRDLLSPRYWRPRGALRALRDLLGPQGDDWRDAGFARHLAARLYRLHRRRAR